MTSGRKPGRCCFTAATADCVSDAQRRLHRLSFFRHSGPSSRVFPRFPASMRRPIPKAMHPRGDARLDGIWSAAPQADPSSRRRVSQPQDDHRARCDFGLSGCRNLASSVAPVRGCPGKACENSKTAATGRRLEAGRVTGSIGGMSHGDLQNGRAGSRRPLLRVNSVAPNRLGEGPPRPRGGPAALTTLMPRGAWSPTVAYVADDLVTLRGSAWRAKRANQQAAGTDLAVDRGGLGAVRRRAEPARGMVADEDLSAQRPGDLPGLDLPRRCAPT